MCWAHFLALKHLPKCNDRRTAKACLLCAVIFWRANSICINVWRECLAPKKYYNRTPNVIINHYVVSAHHFVFFLFNVYFSDVHFYRSSTVVYIIFAPNTAYYEEKNQYGIYVLDVELSSIPYRTSFEWFIPKVCIKRIISLGIHTLSGCNISSTTENQSR